MKNTLLKLLLLVLAAALVFSFASCGDSGDGNDGGDSVNTPPTGDNGDNNGDNNGDDQDADSENLVLIANSKAKFKLILTSAVDASTRKAAESFVKDLQKIGVEIDEYVNDSDASAVSDCEIIVGTGVKNRDAKYALNPKHYGEEGYVIKVVDNKLIIGGGTAEQTKIAFDYFIKNIIKLSSKTKEMESFKMERTYEKLKETKYLIESVEIAGNDLSEYVFVSDLNLGEYPTIKNFRDNLYKSTGYWLEKANANSVPDGMHVFSVNLVEDAGEDGFRAYVTSDGDFIVECSYFNALDAAFANIVKTQIFDKIGDVSIGKSFNKTYCVNKVYYSQFGAVGDGETDDFEAMYNAHVFANQCGQTVMGDGPNYRYFVNEFTKTIPVKTDVDFNGSTIHIDDRGSKVYDYRGLHLFTFTPDYTVQKFNEATLQEMSGGAPILTTDTSVPWLVPYLEATSFVYLYNQHQDYIRHGANAGYIKNRRDVFIIHKDGTIDEETPVYFDFAAGEQLLNTGTKLEYKATKNITYMEIYRIDEKPITMKNGFFERDACESVTQTGYENVYKAYSRGLGIQRSNVTVTDLHHKLISEPQQATSGYGYVDEVKKDSIQQSYPYGGFLAFSRCYNSQAVNVDLWAHTTYYEIKKTAQNPVAMGSYDLIISDACNISLYGLTNGTDYNDSQYWGIMSSYGAKNMYFEKCHMNRFDAHDGFWNAKLIDCEFGFAINVVGGGDLYIEGTTKNVGNSFISLRGDYGATFKGDITLVDCELFGNKPYRAGANHKDYGKAYEASDVLMIINAGYSGTYTGQYEEGNAGAAPYLKWDFGYVNYMPQNLVIDNFKLINPEPKLVLYNTIADAAFVKPSDFIQEVDWKDKNITLLDGTTRPMTPDDVYYNQYQITKSVIYRNMEAIPPCNSDTAHMYVEIQKVTTVEYD